ncbi:MAG: tetratricopeptide repeat protein, partial [Bacteroidia bacterium]|nr:tetratricopeptide repeat protein [Bacteroidia bacterium]
TRQTWEQAANFSLNNGGNLEEALGWIDGTIAGQFFSQQTFNNTNIKAQILNKMGRQEEAAATLDSYLSKASILEMHQIGRTYIAMGMADKAMEVFSLNAENHKDTWPVHYGMARAYSAKGDFKNALNHLRKALLNAPNPASKGRIQANIEKLEKGEDIN